MNKNQHSDHGKFRHPVTQKFLALFARPVLLFSLILTIPAFYLILGAETEELRQLGHGIYLFVAVLMSIDMFWQWRIHRYGKRRSGKLLLDLTIILACFVSSFPSPAQWSTYEWLFRLALCAVILLRIATLVLQHMQPSYLLKLIVMALLMLNSAGIGFYWLEPNVRTFADGVWLAFTTIATVGYGDIVPSTPASKIFAVFIVLLGYALFSIVTANIAALFVGEEEEKFERELHGDILALRRELSLLRSELHAQQQKQASMPFSSTQQHNQHLHEVVPPSVNEVPHPQTE